MANVHAALTALVAALHVVFLVLEAFLWNTPRGRKLFGTTPELAKEMAPLAANQGLYNGFLAAGLAWGLVDPVAGGPVRTFFLGCVVVAGVIGAITVKRSILFLQGVPAMAALAAGFLARG